MLFNKLLDKFTYKILKISIYKLFTPKDLNAILSFNHLSYNYLKSNQKRTGKLI